MEMMDGLPRAGVDRVVAIVPVRDLERSVAFYARLGFAVERYEGGGYAFAFRDEAQVHLRVAEEGEFASGGGSPCGVYLYVTDADAIYEEWTVAGVETLGEPQDAAWRMREFAVSDPDGTLLRVGHRLAG